MLEVPQWDSAGTSECGFCPHRNLCTWISRVTKTLLKSLLSWTSLVVQWLRLCAPPAGDMGLIPGPGRSGMLCCAAKNSPCCPLPEPLEISWPEHRAGARTALGLALLCCCAAPSSSSSFSCRRRQVRGPADPGGVGGDLSRVAARCR